MNITLGDQDLRSGVLALVVALVEIIHDLLRLQAVRRMESDSLSPEQCEQLGQALLDMAAVIADLKAGQGVGAAVDQVRQGLDRLVGDVFLPHSDLAEGSQERARTIASAIR